MAESGLPGKSCSRTAAATCDSEAAVAAGLKWLSRHQAADGSWNAAAFAKDGKCNCGNPGHNDRVWGTTMGLLPFLGAGQTPKDKKSPYAKTVEQALQYLIAQQNADGVLSGNGYIQGMAVIALCEAYGMTGDPQLKAPAQRAINAIVNWQGADGGFRYGPKQNGDMSVTSWHVQALKAGQMAGLNVPNATFKGVNDFLDKVGTQDGSGYGYIQPQPTQRMSAAGLLSRQYMGWGPRHPGLVKGVDRLARVSPTPAYKDMYYYYYATQVMRHMGSATWERWNGGTKDKSGMRDLLIDSQDQGQNANFRDQKGSWDPAGETFGPQFGRLGHTSLCLLTLEVYYRCPPLYRRELDPVKDK